ncbi:MAG TPA: acetylornithine deacetylase [Xanthobacteraceae bacterium]|jgi:acetylornithine deacetylase|nr:acetylornithine deacetylase [Xanthobacteraceae bacterium]
MDIGRSISVLESLVGFDTTSRNSNLELIGWVEAYLDRLGVAHARVPDETGVKANLMATIGNADVPGYILSGHTDVVPVDGQNWASDPFRLTKRDGRLYGRGAADMKGFVACCLAAVPDMLARKLKQPIHLALSYDEEVGCIGVRGIIARLHDAPVKPAACFVGEPTCMQVVIGHKAKRSVHATVRGRTCHSSLAPFGVNAVDYAARLIVKIREVADRLAREGPRDPLYDIPHSTGHTGLVHGGSALNIVPDLCTFEYEFRTIAADDPDALAGEVASYAHDVLEPQMKAVAPEAGIALRDRSSFPGLDTSPASAIVGLSTAFSGRNDLAKVAFGTEAGGYAADGIPSVVVGPGSIDQAHKADEFIAVSELEKCGAFIDRLIDHCSARA